MSCLLRHRHNAATWQRDDQRSHTFEKNCTKLPITDTLAWRVQRQPIKIQVVSTAWRTKCLSRWTMHLFHILHAYFPHTRQLAPSAWVGLAAELADLSIRLTVEFDLTRRTTGILTTTWQTSRRARGRLSSVRLGKLLKLWNSKASSLGGLTCFIFFWNLCRFSEGPWSGFRANERWVERLHLISSHANSTRWGFLPLLHAVFHRVSGWVFLFAA